MALIDKLTAIADAVREKTGGTDALTLEQMATEIEGIEAEGGGLNYDMGEFVLDADTVYVSTKNGIPHKLGETPGFVLVWSDDFSDLSEDNVSPYDTIVNVGYIYLDGLTGLSQLVNGALFPYPLFIQMTIAKAEYQLRVGTNISHAWGMTSEMRPTSDTIGLPILSTSYKWKTGVTYKYFVSKAFWNVGGVANAE